MRKLRLRLDAFRCPCGAAAREVHHRTYDRIGREDMGDLRSVCQRCHARIHELARSGYTLGAATDEVLKPNGRQVAPLISKRAKKRARKKARVPHKAGALRRDIAAMKARQAKKSAQAATRDD